MARQPFFSGNYGSSLAQIDTRPIMQGAAAQAAAYQGIGQNIAGAIEKYQLNKQKRERNEAAAIGTMSGMPPQMLQALSENPETAKLMERIQSKNASPKEFDQFNAMSAAYTVAQKSNLEQENARAKNDALKSQTVITDLQGNLARLTEQDNVRAATLGNRMKELAMEQTKAEITRDEAKEGRDKESAEAELNLVKEKVKGAMFTNDLMKDTYIDLLSKTRSEAQLAAEEVDYRKAQKELTEQTALLKKAEAFTEKNKKKYNPGDPVTVGGKPFYWDGSKVVPVGAELTPSEATKEALKAFGGDALLTYYNNTRNDAGEIDLGSGWTDQLESLDPLKEKLLLKIGMKVNDKKPAPQPAPQPTSGTAGGTKGIPSIGYNILNRQ
jgi:hypothetical protein